MNRARIIFQDVPVSRETWLANARSLVGVPGSKTRNYLLPNEVGRVDLAYSSLRCDGVVTATARASGLLDPDFDLATARWRLDLAIDEWAEDFLQTNFVQFDKGQQLPGDVLLMWFQNLRPAAKGPHHFAILSRLESEQRAGLFIHTQGANSPVIETPFDALDWEAVHSIWRPRAVIAHDNLHTL